MSRYDYPDPGTDPRYCDAISAEPEREECPDCHGAGELIDPEPPNTWVDCGECHGTGYYEEGRS